MFETALWTLLAVLKGLSGNWNVHFFEHGSCWSVLWLTSVSCRYQLCFLFCFGGKLAIGSHKRFRLYLVSVIHWHDIFATSFIDTVFVKLFIITIILLVLVCVLYVYVWACLMVFFGAASAVLIDLSLFIPLPMTLTLFQGDSCIKQ